MTLNYYVYEVRNLLSESMDDSNLDDRLIIRWINTQRVLWIKNQGNREYTLEDNIIQNIPALELKVASGTEAKMLNSTRQYLVSKRKLPKPIEFKDRLGIISVRVPEIGGYEINMVEKGAIRFSGNGVFNSRDIFGTYHNGRLYFKIPKNNYRAAMLSYVSVDIICENPLELEGFVVGTTQAFNQETDDYPMSDALWEYMIGEILRNKAGLIPAPKLENDDRGET